MDVRNQKICRTTQTTGNFKDSPLLILLTISLILNQIIPQVVEIELFERCSHIATVQETTTDGDKIRLRGPKTRSLFDFPILFAYSEGEG